MSAAPSRSAVVTGAGTGIGRAVARALLADGWGVTLVGRRLAPLLEAASVDAGPHADALAVPADVTDAAGVETVFSAHVARFGRLDLLVNNAGSFGTAADVGELSPDDWQAVLAVNVTGAVLCAGAAFRQMSAQTPPGGRIVNNASVSAQSPRPRSVAYTTTKHAISGLSKSIELDGRAHEITCTQLDIGNVRTGLLDGIVGEGALQADGSRLVEPTMEADPLARLLVHVANLPLGVSVPHLTVTAAGMPLIGRG
ncbi:NAD(P)-dependent dehydrogenase (short-subunit alcohol dehydrogenase family) [Agromyces terreus]|uniref:NAD(P)-dependent dehydrogenase (Short-subunit alcohol dehydrogenase family) n=1 Tax=Agromyces terreus TaxID=424795 RepID=A0A9X2K9S3_9MICO|nr:SDR family oxidoreductase [Agromyces terreus]MCP2369548.1 NAD(P)-dependent dehydrogenase (short-subunit alcohol dehydrogenase family) [Agromyces terreus]